MTTSALPKTTTGLAAVLLLLVGCATPDVPPSLVASGNIQSSTPDATTDELSRAVEAAYPADSLAGVTKSSSGLIIHRVPTSTTAAIDDSIRSTHPDLVIDFVDAKHAKKTLDRIAGEIKSDLDHWKERELTISAVAVRSDGSGVAVTARQVNDSMLSTLRSHYGFEDVHLETGTIIPATG